MQITKLEDFGKQKKKVYIDEDYTFWLYYSELDAYDIKENSEITDEKLVTILKETVLIRVKKKALSILERMDRTESELRIKLKQAGYPEPLIEEAVKYVKKFHYINDYQYTRSYIKMKMSVKSRQYIFNMLMQKGIDKELALNAFNEIEAELIESGEESPEILSLRKEITKRTKNKEELTIEDKQKLYGVLCRKGYAYDMIQRELAVITDQYNN